MNAEDKTFWRNDLPRLVAIVIAVATFAYLLYDLTIKGNNLNTLHLWILLIVLALVLGSMASRLRIFNFVDFNLKVDSLRRETKRELAEIRSQVSAIANTETTQKQFTVLNLVSGATPEILEQSLEKQYPTLKKPRVVEGETELEPEKDKFLRRVEVLIARAYETFFIARALQIVISDNRMPTEAGVNLGTGDREERTRYLIEAFLDAGIDVFLPKSEVHNTKHSLEQILKLIDIESKCHSENEPLLPYQEIDKMFDDALDGLGSISAGITTFASFHIINYNQIMSTIKELKHKFGISEDVEQSTSNQASES